MFHPYLEVSLAKGVFVPEQGWKYLFRGYYIINAFCIDSDECKDSSQYSFWIAPKDKDKLESFIT